MSKLVIEDLSVFLPNNIKLEIIKQKLIELYNKEKEYIELKEKNKDKLDTTPDFYKINRLNEVLNNDYRNLITLLKNFNLTDEITTELYIWAKQEREKMELSDNIYNIFDEIIYIFDKYEEINKKVNSKQKF